MKCTFCKEIIDDNYRYCPWCGKCVNEKIFKKRKKIAVEKIAAILFAMAILNAITVFGFICLKNNDTFLNNPLAVTKVTTDQNLIIDTDFFDEEDTSEDTETTVKVTEVVTSIDKTTTQKVSDKNKAIVYVTPSGKRYHLKASCAGKNAVEIMIDEAKESHTPCKKCAGG